MVPRLKITVVISCGKYRRCSVMCKLRCQLWLLYVHDAPVFIWSHLTQINRTRQNFLTCCWAGDMLSVDGDADAAVEARIWIGWNKLRQLVPLLTNRDVSLFRRGRLYSSCVRSSMLHGSETRPVRKENEVALQWAEKRMVRWMCNVKVK